MQVRLDIVTLMNAITGIKFWFQILMSVHYTDHVEMGEPVIILRGLMFVCVYLAGQEKTVKQVCEITAWLHGKVGIK